MTEPPKIDHDERRTYCLVFHDHERDEGDRDLGAAVVDVTGADAMVEWLKWPTMHNQDKGPWLAAAIREAWNQGVNPGGQVFCMQVTPEAPAWVQGLEHNRLYTDAEMAARSQPN